MKFQLQTAIRKISVFILLFLNAQLMPVLAVTDRDKSWDSQSIGLRVAQENQSSESICPAQLEAAIDAVINRPQFRRARWGILIEPLSSNPTNRALYSREAQGYFIPASNVKLLTTAAALRQLSSDFRIRTSIYETGAGVLRVAGRGDPSC